MRYTFQIEGIDCGNCAAKIEALLQKDKQIKEASINFMLQKVEVETQQPMQEEDVANLIAQIANKIEDGITIKAFGQHTHTHKHTKKIVRRKLKAHRHEGHIDHDHVHHAGCGCGGHHHANEQSCGCGDHHHNHQHHEEDDCGCAACGVQLSMKEAAKPTKPKKNYLWARFGASIAFLLLGELTDLNILIAIAYFIIGYDVLLKAFKNIRKGKVFDEHFLMTIATVAAFIIGELPEAVAVMLFYQVGEYFQGRAVAKSRNAIASLMNIKPEIARVYRKGAWKEVKPEEVQIGERLQVRPGEKIPLDGKVIKGVTTVDTSMLTGESMPAYVEEGMRVLSASINLESMIEVEVTHTAKESTVSKVLEMIEHASGRKTTAENFITKFARWYTPTVVILALIVAIIPSLLTGDWHHWVYTSIVFLVISCPCALVVSIPLSFFGGIGAASKQGILVKGSNYLEELSTVDTVVLDKTGTITKGTFEVTDVVPAKGVEETTLLGLAKHIESHSNHPIAKAIVSYIQEEIVGELTDYVEQPGFGITATKDGKKVFAGNKRLMERENIAYEEMHKLGTWVYVATEDAYIGAIGVADVVKPDTKEALKRLKARGIKRIIMLTGDKQDVATFIGKEVGVDEVRAELLPQNKVEEVEKLIDQGAKVAFVGDGINDAPALTLAHVGIAMGGIGSDAAVEASDMVIMTDSLVKVASGIDIAKQTKRIVIQNIVLAIGIKILVMVLGILGIANMWLAIFADVGVSVIAILNAIRILGMKEKK